MAAVAWLRAASYGRHLPALGKRLEEPEAADFEPGCEVLVATAKLDGTVLGTLRIHANVLKPLPLEASLALPQRYVGSSMVEATRLSILGGSSSSLVRSALFKSFYLYCVAQGVDWMLAAGRRPVDRLYDALMFTDVDEAGVYHPMAHASGVPHRVMSLSTLGAEPMWRRAGHPLYQFVCLTQHPDIDLGAAQDLAALRAPGHQHQPYPGSMGQLFHLPIQLRQTGVAA